ncbi:Golgi-specific brefeldin A-resistance guanine nucleotide exchange factor 1 isoform X1, partial [Solea senegalensis]
VEDFLEPNGKISLQREETPSNRGESAVLSFVNWLTLSGAEQSGLRGPSTENQETKQAAILCIKVVDTCLQNTMFTSHHVYITT